MQEWSTTTPIYRIRCPSPITRMQPSLFVNTLMRRLAKQLRLSGHERPSCGFQTHPPSICLSYDGAGKCPPCVSGFAAAPLSETVTCVAGSNGVKIFNENIGVKYAAVDGVIRLTLRYDNEFTDETAFRRKISFRLQNSELTVSKVAVSLCRLNYSPSLALTVDHNYAMMSGRSKSTNRGLTWAVRLASRPWISGLVLFDWPWIREDIIVSAGVGSSDVWLNEDTSQQNHRWFTRTGIQTPWINCGGTLHWTAYADQGNLLTREVTCPLLPWLLLGHEWCKRCDMSTTDLITAQLKLEKVNLGIKCKVTTDAEEDVRSLVFFNGLSWWFSIP